MRPSEIAARMTGIGTPFLSLSWTPPTVDREVARRVVAFLEDRRVLYVPSEVENAEHCVLSVLEIRRFLTDTIGAAGVADHLMQALRAMRAACLQFMTDAHVEVRDDDWLLNRYGHPFRDTGSGLSDYSLNQALGRLRGVFGVQVGSLAVAYHLDVEDGLASILPPKPD